MLVLTPFCSRRILSMVTSLLCCLLLPNITRAASGGSFVLGTNLPSTVRDASTDDVYFDARFDLSAKSGANPEVLFEIGNNDQGLSLIYLPGNVLGLYLDTRNTGDTNPEMAVEYAVPTYLLNRTESLSLQWSVKFVPEGAGTLAHLALWLDGHQVALKSALVATADWCDAGNGGFAKANGEVGAVGLSYFGCGSCTFANFTSYATHNAAMGLRYWPGTAYVVPDPVNYDSTEAMHEIVAVVGMGSSAVDYALWHDVAAGAVRFQDVETLTEAESNYAYWDLVPTDSGWFRLQNRRSGGFLTSENSVGNRAAVRSAGRIDDDDRAQWSWDGAGTGFARLLNRKNSGSTPAHLTVEDGSALYGDAVPRVLTGTGSGWSGANWSRDREVTRGATLRFHTLQAEATGTITTLAGGATVVGDHREFGPASDLNATATEAVGRSFVLLQNTGNSVAFALPAGGGPMNAFSLRYSIPDDIDDSDIEDLQGWQEHSLSVEVSTDNGSSWQVPQLKQVSRYDAVSEALVPDTAYHPKIYLEARHLWLYWRYTPNGSGCGVQHELLDTDNPGAIDPDGVLSPALAARNQDEYGEYLDPDATRRFAEMRVFLDPTEYPNGLQAGDRIRFRKNANDSVAYIGIDLIDVEWVDEPGTMPAGYLSITDESLATPAVANDAGDDTAALLEAIDEVRQGNYAGVWVPAGFFLQRETVDFIAGDNIVIAGAGLWHSVLYGADSGPDGPPDTFSHRNFGFRSWQDATGRAAMQLRDVSLIADGTVRGQGGKVIGGAFAPGTRVERVWFQFTQQPIFTGFSGVDEAVSGGFEPHQRAMGNWFFDCRARDTSAGGFILANGAYNMLIDNCHARGIGDDCFAVWAADNWSEEPLTEAVFRHCTGEAPYRARAFGIFGGYRNSMHHGVGADSVEQSGVWISTQFDPYPFGEDEHEMTLMGHMDLLRCGPDEDIWPALRITSYAVSTVIGGTPNPSPGACGPAYLNDGNRIYSTLLLDVANVDVGNMVITSPTTHGVGIDDMRTGGGPVSSEVTDLVLHDIAIDAPLAGHGVTAGSANLQGEATVEQITVTNIPSGFDELDPTDANGGNFRLIDAQTLTDWAP